MIATVHQNYPTGCDDKNSNKNDTSNNSPAGGGGGGGGLTTTIKTTTTSPKTVTTATTSNNPNTTTTTTTDPLLCSPLTPEGAARRSKIKRDSTTTITTTSPPRPPIVTVAFRTMAFQSLYQSIRRMDPKYFSNDRFFTEKMSSISDESYAVGNNNPWIWRFQQECLTTNHTNQNNSIPNTCKNHQNADDTFWEWACDAIPARQVNGAMTGAILSTLITILEYEHDDDNTREAFLLQDLSRIANALIHCAFEESNTTNSSSNGTSFTHSNNNKPLLVPPPSSASSLLTSRFSSDNNNHNYYYSSWAGFRDDDEQVVHKLLQACVLVTRLTMKTYNHQGHPTTTTTTTTTTQSVIDNHTTTNTVVNVGGLLDTCWHVRLAETASSALKQAAITACRDILRTVFLHHHTTTTTNNLKTAHIQNDILQNISQKLGKSDEETWVALQLVEIILHCSCCIRKNQSSSVAPEDDSKTTATTTTTIELWRKIATQLLSVGIATHQIPILEKMCHIFGFLLWQHPLLSLEILQCEYEVFVQSVLLRRLTAATTTTNNAVGAAAAQEEDTPTKHLETEVVLETLTQICGSGGFGSMSVDLADMYFNYDCDIAGTNMYQAILTRLAAIASPDPIDTSNRTTLPIVVEDPGLSSNTLSLSSAGVTKTIASTPNGVTIAESAQVGPVRATNNGTVATAGSGTNTTMTIIVPPKQLNATPAQLNHIHHLALDGMLSVLEYIDQRTSGMTDKTCSVACGPTNAQPITEQELVKRKNKKNQLAKVVESFNTGNPDKGEWLEVAVAEGILENSHDAKAVAKLLNTAPDFDKRRIGIYLSRGPEANFPFHKAVREEFSKLHDYNNLSFASALRRFLAKFRLPGEAQCIDRLMEAFSQELYRQQSSTTFLKNADAVYVLAFSTIMLNTDLHNPTIKTDKRMTKEQFVRNNRGINGGDDIPEDFLSELYDQIKEQQLQVRREASEHLRKFHRHGCPSLREGIREKEKEVQPAVYLSYDDGWTGLHEKEMFKIFSSTCLNSINEVYMRSWDDATIVRILRGLQQMARVAAHLELDCVLNDVLQFLFKQGKEYVMNCIALGLTAPIASMSTSGEQENNGLEESLNEEETTTVGMDTIPMGLLCSNVDGKVNIDISGSSTNRGLLALDCSFILLHKNYVNVLDSWPDFVDCLCALRDARALPAGLADLDDFADSHGNVLPLSEFAKKSQRSLEEYQNSLRDDDANRDKGWFRGFFRKGRPDENEVEENRGDISKSEPSPHVKTLLSVAKAADIEGIVELASPMLPDQSIRKLLDTLNTFPFEEEPCAEQYAVFSLELATRALLSNRKRAVELFLLFLSKFESVLCRVQGEDVPCPFVIERIVVTILRSNIHLYEIPEVRMRIHRYNPIDPISTDSLSLDHYSYSS
jgi:brefeldin A-resistance guanine nucleotide exchange factor 1